MNPEQQPQQPAQNMSTPQQAPVMNAATNDTILAAVSTIPLVGLIIYFGMPTASSFVKYYAKQGTGLFFAYIVVFIAGFILGFIPFIGGLVLFAAYILLFVIWLVLLINALQNRTYRVPVMSDMLDQYLK